MFTFVCIINILCKNPRYVVILTHEVYLDQQLVKLNFLQAMRALFLFGIPLCKSVRFRAKFPGRKKKNTLKLSGFFYELC